MLDQNTDLIGMIFQVSRLMKQKMVCPSDIQQLSMMQTQTLGFLYQQKKATMSEIANYLHIELPSATSLVNKLVKQELAKRYSDPNDRRIVMIMLTEAGKKLLQQSLILRKKKLAQFLSYLTKQQKQELLTIMQTVKAHLDN